MKREVMFAVGDFDHEMSQTRRMLERVPMDRADYRPHDKSFTLGELASHVANLPSWVITMIAQDEYNFATADRMQAFTDRDAMLAHFDDGVAKVKALLAEMEPAALGETWTLRNGDHVIMAQPRGVILRSAGISHIIHHRGQLSIYLRMLDVPLPGMYGPSADEPLTM